MLSPSEIPLHRAAPRAALRVTLYSLLSVLGAVLLTGCGVTVNAGGGGSQASAYDFGSVVVPHAATRSVYTLKNVSSSSETVAASLSGSATLVLDVALSCGPTLAPGASCEVTAIFTPAQSGPVQGTLSLNIAGSGNAYIQTVSLTGTGVQLSPGESLVTATANPLVALYTYQPDLQGTVAVQLGQTTSYGRSTSAFPTPSNGGPVSILVAGMQQSSTYHMQAVLTASNGTVVKDQDHTFATGSFPADTLPTLQATTAPGMNPQPGIELMDSVDNTGAPNDLEAYATDLAGNIIWGYNVPDRASAYTFIQPIKLLPSGNMLLTLSFASQYTLPNQGVTLTPAEESVDLIREIDLAGDPVAQLTLATLNAKMAAAGYAITLQDIHNDLLPLPNGHIILVASTLKAFDNLTGYSGTTNVLGDVLVDLDPNFNVAWVWNEFDHLDVNRHPSNFPDWTHTNSLLYSPDDGDLLVSMRHQNWIVKIDYDHGLGSGNIVWRLGEGGDFKLIGGTDPQDWFYGQHEPSFFGSSTSGVFSLAIMDDGYNRLLANGSKCGPLSEPCYTTVPILSVNEAARTATVTFRKTFPTSQYSVFGGGTTALANGDLEYDLCAEPLGTGAVLGETTVGANPQTVWTLTETGANLYRANRIPSLYPGVQW